MLNLVANSPSTGYTISNSLRFRSSANAFLSRTPSVAGNRTTWTWSGWVKRGTLGASQVILDCSISANQTTLNFQSADTIQFYMAVSGSVVANLITTQVFRDPSAWYHIVAVADTTQATASNRMKLYVNGSQVTAFGTSTYPAQNTQGLVNSTNAHYMGQQVFGGGAAFDGYRAEVNFIDGQALTPSSFGSTNSTTGVWQPAAYTGTYGTNGFYQKYSDIAQTVSSNVGLGKDFSGNTNYWVTNNISVTSGTTYDAMTDVPTLTSATAANYAVLNPLWKGSVVTISNGNLSYSATGATNAIAYSTFGMSSGKWYCEWISGTIPAGGFYVGISLDSINPNHSWLGQNAGEYSYESGGRKANAATQTAYGASWTSGDIIGIAFDADAGSITFYKNGVSQGVAFTGIAAGNYYFACGNNPGSTVTGDWNFGQRPLNYSIPSGYSRLNTYNLPTPTVGSTSSTLANKYMDVNIWAGNGTAGTNIVTPASFKPDFVWVKNRSSGTAYNNLWDTTRGANIMLVSNTTDADQNLSNRLTAFTSTGYTLGSHADVNASGSNYVGWEWRANAGTTSSNTNGSITSTVQANTSAGFSIVTYTGTGANATVGHGLGVAPKFVIVKDRTNGTNDWAVYNASGGALNILYLNSTSAYITAGASTIWNSTIPTSTVFSIGTNGRVNTSSNNYVAYCWAEIAGFSKFGSYTGNGSTDGVFIYTGFIPKFIIIKSSSNAYNWQTYDSARGVYNAIRPVLYPNLANAEYSVSTNDIDFVANGFKLRGSDAGINSNGATYIYMAFATNPFKYSNAF